MRGRIQDTPDDIDKALEDMLEAEQQEEIRKEAEKAAPEQLQPAKPRAAKSKAKAKAFKAKVKSQAKPADTTAATATDPAPSKSKQDAELDALQQEREALLADIAEEAERATRKRKLAEENAKLQEELRVLRARNAAPEATPTTTPSTTASEKSPAAAPSKVAQPTPQPAQSPPLAPQQLSPPQLPAPASSEKEPVQENKDDDEA